MRKVIFVVAFMFLAVAIVGCSRSYIATKDRVDIEVAGNQGVIYGPTPAPHQVANPTRDIYTIDMELPTMSQEMQSGTNVTPRKEKIK